MKITIFNEIKNFDKPIRVVDLLAKDNDKYVCAKVNNRLRELDYIISEDSIVEPLDLTNSDAVTIYQSTLRYVFLMAVNHLFKKVKVTFNYSISRSIFANISGLNGPVDNKILKQIQDEIDKIIKSDLPIERHTTTIEEAETIYNELGYYDKAKILKYRKENTVHMYKCGKYLNYMFGYMLPSTRYLKQYKLRLYYPGIMIQYPRSECKGQIPEFEDAKTFTKALREANEWGNITKSSSIWQMNQLIEDGKSNEFVNLCETKHNNMLAELGLNIKADIDNIRLIAIAGPSSSGKTTFCNRLRIELISRGINPLMISLDNYYKDRSLAPLDENGEPDFEHIEALDIDLFNDNMFRLIQGEKVQLPIYNFETGKRTFTEPVSIPHNEPILIEGIHALNDDLTPSIPTSQKYKIYICPQAQLHIDSQNPISITDIRLIRRLVRDYKYRNSSPIETLKMWPSVRRGEFKWIYPYQENANYVYNSELTYELCVMKKFALEMLEKVPYDSEYYIQANRLVKFLKYFKDIDTKYIPCNSILREFIGGSIFYDN